MNFPLVSIITINYDHPEVTCQMLDSLRKITYPDIEIIVIDNASPNDDPAIITKSFPEVRFFRSEKNLGFAGGNNLGIRMAKGEYVLLLNNDTEVDPGFLEPLVRKMQSDPLIGAVSPKIKFYFFPDTFQYTGFSGINPYTIRGHGRGFGVKDSGQFEEDYLTEFVHGAAMMVPMTVIRKVGLMAESFFLYYEELDWGYRIKQAGYKLWFVHDSLVYHKESVSTGRLSSQKVYYMNRARLLFLRRNVHGLTFIIAILFQLLVSIPKNLLKYFFTGNRGHFNAYSRAISWHVKNIFSRDIHSNPLL